jgi:hypothetical protein
MKRTRLALNRPREELCKPLAYNWERDTEFVEVAGRITGGDRTMDSDEYTTGDGKRKSNQLELREIFG